MTTTREMLNTDRPWRTFVAWYASRLKDRMSGPGPVLARHLQSAAGLAAPDDDAMMTLDLFSGLRTKAIRQLAIAVHAALLTEATSKAGVEAVRARITEEVDRRPGSVWVLVNLAEDPFTLKLLTDGVSMENLDEMVLLAVTECQRLSEVRATSLGAEIDALLSV